MPDHRLPAIPGLEAILSSVQGAVAQLRAEGHVAQAAQACLGNSMLPGQRVNLAIPARNALCISVLSACVLHLVACSRELAEYQHLQYCRYSE